MLSPEVLILAILTGVRWNLRVILMCISLITKDFEHFFTCFSAIQDSSVVNLWFSSIPHVLIGLFGFFMVSFLSSLYILDIGPLSDVGLVKNFFPYRIQALTAAVCLSPRRVIFWDRVSHWLWNLLDWVTVASGSLGAAAFSPQHRGYCMWLNQGAREQLALLWSYPVLCSIL